MPTGAAPDRDIPLGEAVRAYQAAVDDYDRELARVLAVNETDLRCLEILLQELPESSPSQLAERLGLTTGSVTSLLDRLEKAGYLSREAHPTDRRKTVVRATPGFQHRAYALIAPLLDEGQKLVDETYTADQLDLITDFMVRATAVQRRHTERLRGTIPKATKTPAPARSGE
jgi:DNA-binding MarR family transcriptional regulator